MVGLEPDAKAAVAKSVLIVEDEVLTRVAAAEYLRDSGFTVIEAANADEALAIVAARSGIDLVFTDIQMPGGMDGLTLARWLEKHKPDLPVIVTSAAVKEAAVGERGRRFVRKPYSLTVVEDHIRELLGGRDRSNGGG